MIIDFRINEKAFLSYLCILMLSAALLLNIISSPSPQVKSYAREAGSEEVIKQFTAEGHVLGFDQRAVYIAGIDHALRLEFENSQPIQPVAKASSAASSIAPPLEEVILNGVWEGIDIVFSAVEGGIAESTYIIHPGSDPDEIRLIYNVPVEISNRGGLRLNFDRGYMSESAPVAWQEIDGESYSVDVGFKILGENRVGFNLGDYDSSYKVYIDPIYQWHTFHGSSIGSDSGNAIAVNDSGDIFVVGNSRAAWDGPGNTSPLNDYSGSDDIVVVKLDKNGFYQWHTFYGSVEADLGNAVALDQAGNIYVAGRSRSTWDGPLGQSPLNAHEGCSNDDLVVIKLNSDGDYKWHTFYGSVDQDTGNAIVLDASDNIYVAGRSDSTWDGPGGQVPLNAHSGGYWDLIVVKLSNTGAYQWHSFYGSSEREAGNAIAIDSAGHIYLTGRSDASWNGPGGENPINGHSGSNSDILLIKIDAAGNYHWHTFYGSSDQNLGYSIAVDSANGIYLAGFSNSAWNGPDGEIPLNAHSNGDRDAVIVKVDSSGQYHWHTFYGSEKKDQGHAIAVDKADNIYVTGYSEDYWAGPELEEPLDEFFDIDNDANIFVLKLDSMGIYRWHSFYGAEGWNIGRAITVDQADNLYLAGSSGLSWDGPDDKEPRNEHSGPPNRDITVIKTNLDPPPQAGFLGNPASGPVPLDVQFTDQSTQNPLGWAWYFGDEDLSAIDWTEMTGSAAWAGRYGHVAVALPDGSIVIMGGKFDNVTLNDVWRSTDQGQTWTLINDNSEWSKRFRHAGTVLPDGSIILMGGRGESDLLNDVWRSTDYGHTWKRLTFDADWSKREYLSAVALSDGSIVVMGGDDGSCQNDVWRSSDRGTSWTRLTEDAPWSGRYAHTGVVLPDNSIVLMGGEDDSGLTNDVWLSTDHGTEWTEMTGSAGWSPRKWHTSVVLPDGSIITMGGWDGSSALNDLWRSVDNGSTWAEIHKNAAWEARALHVSTVLNDGSVVFMGGHDENNSRNDVWSLQTAGSNEQNPAYTYRQSGSYDVTMQSYNASGYNCILKPAYVEVSSEKVSRLFGLNRYETAVAISKDGWDSTETVVLARGDDYADALAGVPLAFRLNAPILLTPTASLDGDTKDEIERLGASEVILLGGRAAISDDVKGQLEAEGLSVDRIAGSNRYHTAALIAERLGQEGADFDTAFIAVGTNFADALAASSYAAMRGEPILLTGTNQLPGATSDVLNALGIEYTYVCGGTAAVSSEVFDQLPGPKRISGANRYATALALAGEFLPGGATHVGIATGLNFPDAIAGGVWAAKQSTGILLVDGSKSEPGGEVQDFIADNEITAVTLFGGSGAISSAMADWFEDNLGD